MNRIEPLLEAINKNPAAFCFLFAALIVIVATIIEFWNCNE